MLRMNKGLWRSPQEPRSDCINESNFIFHERAVQLPSKPRSLHFAAKNAAPVGMTKFFVNRSETFLISSAGNNSALQSFRSRFRTVLYIQFLQNVAYMQFHRNLGYIQRSSNFFVTQACCHHAKNFQLPGCQ